MQMQTVYASGLPLFKPTPARPTRRSKATKDLQDRFEVAVRASMNLALRQHGPHLRCLNNLQERGRECVLALQKLEREPYDGMTRMTITEPCMRTLKDGNESYKDHENLLLEVEARWHRAVRTATIAAWSPISHAVLKVLGNQDTMALYAAYLAQDMWVRERCILDRPRGNKTIVSGIIAGRTPLFAVAVAALLMRPFGVSFANCTMPRCTAMSVPSMVMDWLIESGVLGFVECGVVAEEADLDRLLDKGKCPTALFVRSEACFEALCDRFCGGACAALRLVVVHGDGMAENLLNASRLFGRLALCNAFKLDYTRLARSTNPLTWLICPLHSHYRLGSPQHRGEMDIAKDQAAREDVNTLFKYHTHLGFWVDSVRMHSPIRWSRPRATLFVYPYSSISVPWCMCKSHRNLPAKMWRRARAMQTRDYERDPTALTSAPHRALTFAARTVVPGAPLAATIEAARAWYGMPVSRNDAQRCKDLVGALQSERCAKCRRAAQDNCMACRDMADARTCPICLDECPDGAGRIVTGCCVRVYHAGCLAGHAGQGRTTFDCPSCRTPFRAGGFVSVPPGTLSARWSPDGKRRRRAHETAFANAHTALCAAQARAGGEVAEAYPAIHLDSNTWSLEGLSKDLQDVNDVVVVTSGWLGEGKMSLKVSWLCMELTEFRQANTPLRVHFVTPESSEYRVFNSEFGASLDVESTTFVMPEGVFTLPTE